MLQTQVARSEERKQAESPREQDGLETANLPSSPKARSVLKKQLQREITAMEQEAEFLSGEELNSQSERIRIVISGRLRAMNPFRDFHRLGTTAMNGGVSVWKDPDDAVNVSAISAGAVAALALPTAAWLLTHNIAIAGGAAAFGLAPLFFISWGARTLFNLVAGAPVALASPIFLGIAKLLDIFKPGELRGSEFAGELRKKGITRNSALRASADKRVLELKAAIDQKEAVLASLSFGRVFSRDEIRERWLRESEEKTGENE